MNRPYPFHDTAKRGILLLLLLFPISLFSAPGWGSWENGSLLERVYLPAGLSLRLHLLERRAFDAPLLSNLFFERERKGLSVRPGIHTAEGPTTPWRSAGRGFTFFWSAPPGMNSWR